MKRYVLSLVTLLYACTPQNADDETTATPEGSGGSASNAGGSGGSGTTNTGGAQANSSGGAAGAAGEAADTEGSSDSGGSAGASSGGSSGEGGADGSETSIGGTTGSGGSSGGASGDSGGTSTGGASTGGSGTTGGLDEVGPDGLIVKQLAVGYGFACALTVRGGVKCWGEDSYGTLGGSINTVVATDVEGLTSGVKAIAASATFFHVCALKEDGAVLCWGANERQQLDIDDEEEGSSVPVQLKGYQGPAASMTLGDSHWCFVEEDTGGLKCLGTNSNYTLGVEAPETSIEAIPVTGAISGYQQVAAGSTDSCGLLTNGGIKCWGRNLNGIIGDGSETRGAYFTPSSVMGYGPGEAVATKISVGMGLACALDTEGAVKCWGARTPSATCSSCPTTVSGLSAGVTDIASGRLHSCAAVTSGAVFCWGDNTFGQIGNGEQGGPGDPGATTPVAAAGIENALVVGAGLANSCASLKSGGVQCWGNHWVAGSADSENVLVPNTVAGFSE